MYLYFALGILSANIFYLIFHGVIFEININIPVEWRVKIRLLGYTVSTLFLLLFTRLYLDTKRTFLLADNFLKISIVIFLLYTLAVFMPFGFLFYLNLATLFTYPFWSLVQMITGIVVLIRRHKPAIYFTLSYLTFNVASVMHMLYINGFVEQNFYLKHASITNMAIFAVLLTAGLSENVGNIRKEKSLAKQLKLDKEKLLEEVTIRKKVEEELNVSKQNLEVKVLQRTKELSENEQKYSELVEQMHDWVWQVDKDCFLTYSSTSIENIFGFKIVEIINRKFSDIFEKQYIETINEILKPLDIRKTGYTDIEAILNRPDGKLINVEISAKPVYDENQQFSGYRGIIHDITVKKNIEKQILKAMLETEENERKRFAAELHDGLGATLSGINMYLNTIQSENLDENIRKELLNKVHELVRIVAADARKIASNIRPYELSYLGLKSSIENLCQRIVVPNKITIQLDFEQFTIKPPDDIELVIFRIISELLNNTLKHSKAQRIDIKMQNTDSLICIRFSDNGIGFDYQEIKKINSGMGLQNIITRLQTIKGTVSFVTRANQGFVANIEISLN